ncbi:protein VACUOLELESS GAMETOPHYTES-like [Malus domestica]|uniref:protein VACUOLELESS GAMETOPHYTES-like n=1 Tax=Malus domestica TaxID=3750 RepID=UPI003974C2F9
MAVAMVKHFGHRHELCSFQVQEEVDEIIICSGCDLELMMNSGTSAYKCSKSKCQFYLHDLCFELPRQIKHKSHPQHPLTLVSNPPYEYGEFKCDACAEYGSNCFAFHCVHCKYDLHLQCAALPETLGHPHHHEHTLTLRYSSLPPNHDQGKRIMCDLCGGSSPEGCWVYC